jgi:formylglycine-generating enzyme required for sulfatase activity
MSYLPAATFTMGSNDKKNKKYWLQAEDEPEWPWLDEPVHKVSLDAFCMDITEVTVPAYRACVQSGKCAELPKPYCSWHKPHSDDHPQDCATWADADQFCRVVGKRLPTEEEWEYGARGTDGRRYPWGNSDPHSDTHSGGYREFCRRRPGDIPCPVGQFKRFASPFGLLDMTGNLEEWTSSDYCASDKRCGKIVRGSGGPTISEMRGAHRSSAWATDSGSLLGFRCALSL